MNILESDSAWRAAVQKIQKGAGDTQPSLLDILRHHLAAAYLHEIFANSPADLGSAFGFAQILGAQISGAQLAQAQEGRAGPCFWVRAANRANMPLLHAPGLSDMGCAPDRYFQVHAPDPLAALRAAADIARCSANATVLLEIIGHPKILDLTATRRLALAAEKSGSSVILLRVDAQPAPSAAYSRWQVKAAPSRAFAANAPGRPCFDIELLRHRKFVNGAAARLEWDSIEKIFRQVMMDKDSAQTTSNRKASKASAAAFGGISAFSARRPNGAQRQSAA